MAAHTSVRGSEGLPEYLLIHGFTICLFYTDVCDRQPIQEFNQQTSCTVNTQRRPRTFALVLELNKGCGNRAGSLFSPSRHENTVERLGKL